MEYLHQGLAVQYKHLQLGFHQLFTIYLIPRTDSNSAILNVSNINYYGIHVKNHLDSKLQVDLFSHQN
jgi:hypothetical protein